MLVEFVGQSARDGDNVAANPSRLINCYVEPVAPGGRASNVLKSVLGQTAFCALPGVFARALADVEGALYALMGGTAYEVNSDGSYTSLGAVADGEGSICGNNGIVALCGGGEYHVWNGTTLTEPTLPLLDFTVGSIDTVGNYTVLTGVSDRRFCWSDIADATTLPGLNFSTADGKDDLLVRCFGLNGQLYLFKQTSHEVWYVTGQSGANAFQRAAGGVADLGLKDHDLICRIDGGAFMVGHDGRAYLIGGGSAQPVSIPPVETAIDQNEIASCFAYSDEGHSFCVITFADRAAWVYDIATGMWHERAEGVGLDPWTARVSAKSGGEWFVAFNDGDVSTLGRTNYDGDKPLVREATSLTMYADGQRFTVREFELYPRQGVSVGAIELFLSRDGGMTWGAGKARAVGPVGAYGKRVTWRNQGQFRSATAKIRWTDAADITLETKARIRT